MSRLARRALSFIWKGSCSKLLRTRQRRELSNYNVGDASNICGADVFSKRHEECGFCRHSNVVRALESDRKSSTLTLFDSSLSIDTNVSEAPTASLHGACAVAPSPSLPLPLACSLGAGWRPCCWRRHVGLPVLWLTHSTAANCGWCCLAPALPGWAPREFAVWLVHAIPKHVRKLAGQSSRFCC